MVEGEGRNPERCGSVLKDFLADPQARDNASAPPIIRAAGRSSRDYLSERCIQHL